MSLMLDLGLFFRNSKTKLGLSLTQRGLLFTLACRIGSNASTWIKQSTLAKEAGIDERNIRENMIKIKSKGIVLVEYQDSDKRKLQYRFNKRLTNYHLLSEEERIKVHLHLNDEYEHLNVLKHKSSSKNYRTKSSGNDENTGRNHPVNTGRNHPLISENDASETLIDTGLQGDGDFPKAKDERNKKLKEKEFLGVDNFKITQEKDDIPEWLPKENWEEFKQHRKEMKRPLSKLAEKKAINCLEKLRNQGNDIVDVIEKSIASGWHGLFPLQNINKSTNNYQAQSKPKQEIQNINLPGWEPVYKNIQQGYYHKNFVHPIVYLMLEKIFNHYKGYRDYGLLSEFDAKNFVKNNYKAISQEYLDHQTETLERMNYYITHGEVLKKPSILNDLSESVRKVG